LSGRRGQPFSRKKVVKIAPAGKAGAGLGLRARAASEQGS